MIFFPGSHIVQIRKIIIENSVEGVSSLTFIGYFLGNMGAYLFSQKYTDIRILSSFILTAILEVVIVAMTAYYNGRTRIMWSVIFSGLLVGVLVFLMIVYKRDWVKKNAGIAGWFPAIIFPGSTVFQLTDIIGHKNIHGVSCLGWIMQVFANLGAYLLVGKPDNPQNILAFIGTAIVDIIIIIVIIKKGGNCSIIK